MRASDDLQVYLKVNSASFEKGMTEATKRVERYKQKASKVPEVNQKLSNAFGQAANNTAIFMGPLDGLAGRLSAISSALPRFSLGMLGVGLSLGATAIYGLAAVRAYTRLEEQMLRTEGVLRATGFIAGFTARELEAMAQTGARATLASLSGMRKAQQILLTFRGVQNETFTQALGLAQDMSEVFGGLEQSALQLGKALNDPTQGLSALSRAGVTFSQEQKDRINQWVLEGELAKAQAEILKEVNAQLGGVAEKVSDGSIAGYIDSIGQSWENILTLSAEGNGLGEAWRWLTRNIDEAGKATEAFIRKNVYDQNIDSLDAYNAKLQRQQEVEQQLTALRAEQAQLDKQGKPSVRAAEVMEQIRDLTIEQSELTKDLVLRRAAVLPLLEEERKAKKRSQEEQDKFAAQQAAEANRRGLDALRKLQAQMGNEENAIFASHEKRLEEISKVTLSQEELQKQGFSSIQELREKLTDDSIGLMSDELTALADKHAKEQQMLKDKLEREAEMLANAKQQAQEFADRFNPALSDTDRQEKQALVELKSLYENNLLPDTLTYEEARTRIQQHFAQKRAEDSAQEAAKHADAVSRLAAFTARLSGQEGQLDLNQKTDLEQLQADLDAKLISLEQFGEAELAIVAYYEEQKAKLKQDKFNQELDQKFATNQALGDSVKQLAQWETQTTQQKYAGMMNLGNQFLGSMATQSRTAFKMQKAIQVAQAVMNTYTMATGAYQALAGIPYVGPILGAAAAAAAIAFGMAQVNSIRRAQPQGQFHQGIDYVPETGNYTLLRGERVLDERLNSDLKKDLAQRKRGQGRDGDIHFNIQAHDASGFDRLLMERRDLVVGMMHEYKAEYGEEF